MIAIPVQVDPAGMSAERIPDVAAALLVQGFVVVDAVTVKFERGTVFACQAMGDEDLFE